MPTALDRLEEGPLGRYNRYNARSARHDERRGQADARRGMPPSTGLEYAFRDEIIAEARRHFSDYKAAWQSHVGDLTERIERFKTERDDYTKKTQLEDQKQLALDEIDQQFGSNSIHYRKRNEDVEKGAEKVRHIRAAVQRPPQIWLSHMTYLPILLLLALLEVPINRFAFEFFFQEIPILSLLIALGTGILLIGMSHLIGKWLKQVTSHDTLLATIFYSFGIAILVTLSLMFIYLIARIRQAYIMLLETEQSQSIENLLSGSNLIDVAKDVFSVPLDAAGYGLLLLNFAIVFIGVALSFVRHDPHPGYEPAERQLSRSQKKLRALESKYERKRQKVGKRYDEQILYHDRAVETIEREIEVLGRGVQTAKERIDQNVDRLCKTLRSRLLNYQRGNATRDDGKIPECFESATEDDVRKRFLSESVVPRDGVVPMHVSAQQGGHVGDRKR